MEVKTTAPPAKSEKEYSHRPKFHCGLAQRGTAVEDRILNSIQLYEVAIHRFNTIGELHTHCQRTQLDMVVVAGNGPMQWMMELVAAIKQDSTLQFLPVVMFHPAPERHLVLEAYRLGVDEVVTNFWDYELVQAKIEMLVARSKRDLGVNPTTRLPGPAAIELEVNRRLRSGEDFAVCYADLDNFKAYNDYYGYFYGDKIILMTSHIIRNTVHDLVKGGFVGHIGGDDFIFIIPPEKIHVVCRNIISTFDRMIPYRYQEEDRERGYISVPNRRGEMENFPIMTISIAVMPNQKRTFSHIGEMSHMMADLKKYTKSLPGSNYMVERRRKY